MQAIIKRILAMKKKRWLSVIIGVASCLLILTACGTAQTTKSAGSASSSAASSETASVVMTQFDAAFSANPLDADCEAQLAAAKTEQAKASIYQTFAGLWESEIDHAYASLVKTAEGAAFQQEWNDWKQSSQTTAAGTTNDPKAQMEQNRQKAKELYEKLYSYEPGFTFLYASY